GGVRARRGRGGGAERVARASPGTRRAADRARDRRSQRAGRGAHGSGRPADPRSAVRRAAAADLLRTRTATRTRTRKSRKELSMATNGPNQNARLQNQPSRQEVPKPPAISELHILWISEGMSCDGDTVSITAATQPSI